ncbi:hypothetical protein ACH5RR_039043 [Cinchona calisaya]|uniref:CTLH domain-containing protein n=1 Tax=Cinchona calisaya TaxID=153742 RepID=A0ABD2Y164_9GENT
MDLKKDLEFLIHQFLAESESDSNGKNYKETLHKLEKESGPFFNLKYFEECVIDGDWEEVEKYLSGFTKLEDNPYSKRTYFEIRKQKYFEALDKRDQKMAVEILKRDLKEFFDTDSIHYCGLTLLLRLNDLREQPELSEYGDEKTAREQLVAELKKFIEANPLLCNKLQFPDIETSRLQTLINQSLNWQTWRCNCKVPSQDMPTLYVDHSCGKAPSPEAASITTSLAGRTVHESSVQPMGLSPPSISIPKDRRSAAKQLRLGNQTDDSQHILKESRLSCIPEKGGDVLNLPSVKPKLQKLNIWKLKEIKQPSEFHTLKLSDNLPPVKAKTAVPPVLWCPSSGISMTNDIRETDLEEALPCLALSKNESYVVSASGEKISLFNIKNFEVTEAETMAKFMSPPPATTCLAFYPPDNNLIVIGTEDSEIRFFDPRDEQVKYCWKGHQNRVTGLAFSTVLNVLVSTGANAQICVCSMCKDGLQHLATKFLDIPSGHVPNPLAQTPRLTLHQNQTDVLVVHERFIAVYEARELNRWTPEELSMAVTDAAYSCDCQLIYSSFVDGSISVFTPALKLRCRINPTAYLPSYPSLRLHPLAIAAHPSESNQFAVGLTDGGVHIFEPLESEATWGTEPPDDNYDAE